MQQKYCFLGDLLLGLHRLFEGDYTDLIWISPIDIQITFN